MVRTQIQLPDDLYRQLKAVAQQKEWTLAETLRRAAEQFLERQPSSPMAPGRWQVPEAQDLGWRGLTHEQVREAALEDAEPAHPMPHS